MKFAATADVHGNCVALEAVLADIAAVGVAEVVNPGDHVSGPLEPRRGSHFRFLPHLRHGAMSDLSLLFASRQTPTDLCDGGTVPTV